MILAALSLSAAVSCDKFLDQMPDNRAEIDSESKVISLLTSAYPDRAFATVTELLSDNADDYSVSYIGTDRFADQTWSWDEITEDYDENPEGLWSAYYMAIANANEALAAIKKMEETPALQQAKAEALLCRAYAHFMLVNLFSLAYNKETSASDLGVPFLSEPETQLNPKYQRGTVAEVYEKIGQDLEEALPLVGDANYTVPKYHFNTRAAYAFATRYYLYTEQWQKAINAATTSLGSTPKSVLRNWSELGSNLSSGDYDVMKYLYIDANASANFMLLTAWSQVAVFCGPYSSYSKYSHGSYISATEDYQAGMPWGSVDTRDYYYAPKVYTGALDRVTMWTLPYLFEYTDPVAGIGYPHTVYPAFFAEETLLNRIEANIMLKNYSAAVDDINLWAANMFKSAQPMTASSIIDFIKGKEYYSYEKPTLKKHINPVFAYDGEGSDQEAMLQFLLYMRRIETQGQGFRWFDVKRYGIEIERRIMSPDGDVQKIADVLAVKDPRRAIQVPKKVYDAGLEKNPR